MSIMIAKNTATDKPQTQKDRMLEKVSGMLKIVKGNETQANQRDGHKTLSDYSWPLQQLQRSISAADDPRILRDMNISINRLDELVKLEDRYLRNLSSTVNYKPVNEMPLAGSPNDYALHSRKNLPRPADRPTA